MKRAPSALVLIGGFGVAVATLSVAATAAIVLLAPQPPVLRMSAATAIAALRGDVPSFERRIVASPPGGVRALLAEQTIATELRRSPADVRAVWLDGGWPPTATRVAMRGVGVPAGLKYPRSGPFIMVGDPGGRLRMVAVPAVPQALRRAMVGVPLPAFVASVRGDHGRWISVRPVQPLLSGWRLNVLIALAVSLLLLVPLAWLFARRLTRPFRVLAGALGGNADAVPDEGPHELREAAVAISAMRSRLAVEAAERARMLTAIAHDLRTPLTGLRLRIEASPEPQRARMIADVERMQAMIGEVLSFARDAAASNELVDVRPLLAEIVADMSAGCVRLAPGDEARIAVPAPAFRRVVENLVRNAIDYAGGAAVGIRREDGDIVVSVADSGPGISAADRERLLLPFERGDGSRNRGTGGAGLGLSIVRDFAARHRGDFTLSGGPGGGTVAALRLPAA